MLLAYLWREGEKVYCKLETVVNIQCEGGRLGLVK